MSAPAKNPTRRQKVEAREGDILRAAHDIFLERGIDKSTMAEIARRSGVSEGTLYLYFENKHALMQAVLTKFYEKLTLSVEKGILEHSETRDRIRFLAHRHLEGSLAEWRMLMLASTLYRDEISYRESKQYFLNKTYVKSFDSVIREARNRGEVPEASKVSVLRDLFYGSLEHLGRTLMLKDNAAGFEEALDLMMPSLYAAIGLNAKSGKGMNGDLGGEIARLERIVADMKHINQSNNS